MAAIERIDRSHSRLAAEVYQRLVDALVQGTLNQGDRLIQDRLAEELDVSRTPVRDALLRLQEEGVLEPSGRWGSGGRSLSEQDLRDLYGARDAVEGHAAALVAELGPDALDDLRGALVSATSRKLRSSRESFEANRSFHRAIVATTGNAYLLNFFDNIWGRAISGLAYHDFYIHSPHDQFVAEHESLIKEFAAGDPVRARQAMIEHIAWGLERTVKAESEKPRGSGNGRGRGRATRAA